MADDAQDAKKENNLPQNDDQQNSVTTLTAPASKMPSTYGASLTTGTYGSYSPSPPPPSTNNDINNDNTDNATTNNNDNTDTKDDQLQIPTTNTTTNKMPSTYAASYTTGSYGSYVPTPSPPPPASTVDDTDNKEDNKNALQAVNKMPATYAASLTTGSYGSYAPTPSPPPPSKANNNDDNKANTSHLMPSTYAPSYTTGAYGSYVPTPSPPPQAKQNNNDDNKDNVSHLMPSTYAPSYTTGAYGSYTPTPSPPPKIPSNDNDNDNKDDPQAIDVVPPKQYKYLVSINNGSFGTWLYNASSPTVNIAQKQPTAVSKPIKTQTKPKKAKSQVFTRRSYGFSRKIDPSNWKFEKRTRTPEEQKVVDSHKWGVKLIQEWELKTGKSIIKYYKKQNKNKKKNKNKNKKNDDQKQNDDVNQINQINQLDPKGKGKFYICEGSVVKFSGEAIVNAANEGMLGGGGVDGAISDAGGDQLYYLRRRFPTVDGNEHIRCRTGDAKLTLSGYPYNKLKCDYVIHAVGPAYSTLLWSGNMKVKDIDLLLYNSYAKTMLICKEKNIKSIGFCLISSGIFRGPRSLDAVLTFGINAIKDYMFAGIEVYLIGYKYEELMCLHKLGSKLLGNPIKEHSQIKEKRGWGGWRSSSKKKNKKNNDADGLDNRRGFLKNLLGKKKKSTKKGNKNNKGNDNDKGNKGNGNQKSDVKGKAKGNGTGQKVD